ncbi:MAG TPA: TonB-dependent receptor, partial [Caulobacteraceae bacterium]|nr:TonB-dependent receptor [Caulobacteraceae bacterium]
SYDGPFNFSLGANFLRYDTEDKYYVFINTLTLASVDRAVFWTNIGPYTPGMSDNRGCLPNGFRAPDVDNAEGLLDCTYIDPNPIGSLNDMGHNYFLSRNPYKLISYAVFGEAYYNIADDLKLTAGLRWTVDRKEAPRIPSWVVASDTAGYPVAEVIEQEWREPTGRLTLDWKPNLTFTDETLLYGSYAHGYKAGGANPPAAGLVMYALLPGADSDWELLASQQAAIAPRTFEPEFVDAFELGAKNTMFDGRVTLNAAAFYYDYRGYQISQIVNRAAINLNFDAQVWGLELEADWRALDNLRFGLKAGFEDTKMADGSRAIDVMDRAAGRDDNGDGIVDWYVTGPFPTLPANCVLPTYTVVRPGGVLSVLGMASGGNLGPCELAYVLGLDPVTGEEYVENPTSGHPNHFYPGYPGFNPDMPEVNGGAGFYKDLSGNELPNAPSYTATLTADYTVPLPNDWFATLHTDLYYQSEAWTRVFNTPGYDKLKAYTNVNLAAIFTNEDAGWRVMAYVKNVFDRDSITGAFLNSDDTGLTTNVFLTEPRLYGLRVTKEWTGGPWWTGADHNHSGPYPLSVELGGQVQRHDAPNETLQPQSFVDLPGSLNAADDLQGRELDWGDGRSVRLTFRPANTPWAISAGVRYGRTNQSTPFLRTEQIDLLPICAAPAYAAPYFCAPDGPFYRPDLANYRAVNWSDLSARDREEHTIVDFTVGRDFGLGGLANSAVSAGLRYGEFSASTRMEGRARSDFEPTEGWYFYGVGLTDYSTDLRAEREFTGTGPMLTWDAAAALLGDERTGVLALDWSLTGGVLFGKQDTVTSGEDMLQPGFGAPFNPYHPLGGGWPIPADGPPTVFDATHSRSQDVTVPLVDLSVGLSYGVGRVKVGAGYRWERYFDVLDVGFAEEESGDRTIDGPYFKLSVGFGG